MNRFGAAFAGAKSRPRKQGQQARARNRIAHIAFICCIGLVLAASARPARAASSPMPTGKDLTDTVTKLDASFFAAYNDCDLVSFARYVAPDIRFYHDKSGLMVGRSLRHRGTL